MSLGDRVWDAFTTVIQMRDKIALLADAVKTQQMKIEHLSERMVKLETTIELLIRAGEQKQIERRP